MLGADSKSPPPPGLPADVTVISIHPMYSAGQVTLATFLGGPLGGAWLMGLNYKRLGEPAKARRTIGLSVLAMAALIAIGLATGGMLTLVLAFISILALNMLASSLQGDAYDRHVAVGGSRGSSWRAAGLGVASLAIYFAAIASVIEIRAAATRPDKVMLGESSVFYTDGVPRAEAQRVGEELVALKQLRTDARWSVEVTRDGDRRVVAFVLKDSAFSKDEPRDRFHRLAEPLSRDVYDGAPVDVWLIDAMLRPHVKLDWETRPREIDRNDPAQAAARDQKACDGGDLESCSNLGILYAQGIGVVRDAARAAALDQKACDGGAVKGCDNLGMLYEAGNGVVRDAAWAATLYQKACDGGEMIGCVNVGDRYEQGIGVVRDAAKAAAAYRKACAGGEALGCSRSSSLSRAR